MVAKVFMPVAKPSTSGQVQQNLGNIQDIKQKTLVKLKEMQENIDKLSQILKEKSSHKNDQVQKKSTKSLMTIQEISEDISNENSQGLEKFLGCSGSVQAMEEESFHRKDQSVQKKISHEKVQAAQKKSSHENNKVQEEKSSHGNVQAVEEEPSHSNYQSVQKEFSHKEVETTQEESSNENDRIGEKKYSHENVQAEEEECSHRDDQSVQEKLSYGEVQMTQESSRENNRLKKRGSSHGNIDAKDNEKSSDKNNQLTQEESSRELVRAAQKKSSHQDADIIEDRSTRGNGCPPDDAIQENTSQGNSWYLTWLQKASVEPTMWLYMMAFMFTSVVEQDFFLYKACRVDHGYSEETCSHLKDFKLIKTEVQKTVSEFQQWYNFAGHIVPILLALFYGNWSDRRGRKLLLIIGLTGKLIYSFMIVINSLMMNWNLNMVIYTAVIPMGILGADAIIFSSCFAYLTDICSLEERTIRITILDVVYLSTMPTGIVLGSYIFTKVNSSYTIMFAINSSMLVLAIVYSLVQLKWQSSPEQESLVDVNFFKDFFDVKHVRETVNVMTKSRANDGRLCLICVMLAMCLYTFQRDEKIMSYLYTQLVFSWDVIKFSNFRTFQSSLYVAAMLCAMPALKYFKLRDTVITMIGATSHSLGRLIFILAKTGKVFYAGAVVASLGPMVASSLRSMISKFVDVEERGKAFAILSVFDNVVPLISSVFYSQVYNAIYTVPNFIYWLTFITQICVILLATAITYITWRHRMNAR